MGIGSGPGMAFSAKGVPAKAVAAMYGLPRNIAVMVGNDSDVKTVNDLKGKKLGVTTVGSLTAWVGQRINEKKGWDGNGIDVVPIGGMPPARAAIKTHQLDGYIGALERNGASSPPQPSSSIISSPTSFSRAMNLLHGSRKRCAPFSRAGSTRSPS
jgi:ABC-type nitrate/sulfonate/bicarbonate transport system substrate-binding protein